MKISTTQQPQTASSAQQASAPAANSDTAAQSPMGYAALVNQPAFTATPSEDAKRRAVLGQSQINTTQENGGAVFLVASQLKLVPVARRHEYLRDAFGPAADKLKSSDVNWLVNTVIGEQNSQRMGRWSSGKSFASTVPQLLARIRVGDDDYKSPRGSMKRIKTFAEDARPMNKLRTILRLAPSAKEFLNDDVAETILEESHQRPSKDVYDVMSSIKGRVWAGGEFAAALPAGMEAFVEAFYAELNKDS